MAAIAPGRPAPDFTLPTADASVTLSALRGRKVVLYFYPADDTETCTLEAIDFSARLKEFKSAGTTVIGISPDPPHTHERFCRKHALGTLLASDIDLAVIRRYGLWIEKSMFGRTFLGVERATFLIDKEGRVAEAWRKVRIKGHVEAVLSAARAL